VSCLWFPFARLRPRKIIFTCLVGWLLVMVNILYYSRLVLFRLVVAERIYVTCSVEAAFRFPL